MRQLPWPNKVSVYGKRVTMIIEEKREREKVKYRAIYSVGYVHIWYRSLFFKIKKKKFVNAFVLVTLHSIPRKKNGIST